MEERIKNKKLLVNTMAEIIYDWKRSRKVYEIFKTIYENQADEKPSVKWLSEHLGKDKGNITAQMRALKKMKLINETVDGRNKYFTTNKKELEKITGMKDDYEFYELVLISSTFEGLLHSAKWRFEHKKNLSRIRAIGKKRQVK